MDLEKLIKEHINEEGKLIDLHHRAIFGDAQLGEKGMKEKIDEVHGILTNIKGTGKVFGGTLNTIKTLMVIVAIIGVFKGWWIALVHLALNK